MFQLVPCSERLVKRSAIAHQMVFSLKALRVVSASQAVPARSTINTFFTSFVWPDAAQALNSSCYLYLRVIGNAQPGIYRTGSQSESHCWAPLVLWCQTTGYVHHVRPSVSWCMSGIALRHLKRSRIKMVRQNSTSIAFLIQSPQSKPQMVHKRVVLMI